MYGCVGPARTGTTSPHPSHLLRPLAFMVARTGPVAFIVARTARGAEPSGFGRRPDDRVDRPADSFGGLLAIRLACVEPRGHGFDRHGRDELCRPAGPSAIGNHARELAVRQRERLGSQTIHLLLERGLSGSVVKEEAKGGRI